MPLFEKSKQLSQSNPPPPRPTPTPPKFNPPNWTSSIYRPTRPQKPMVQKPLAPKPAPEKPKTLFESKKDWKRGEFLRKTTKDQFTSRGKMYSAWERKKLIEEALPSRRFSTYISEGEVKRRLKELRREEYRAKTGAEKTKIGNLRKYLEKQTGLKGKY
jgi:hypothetical protein